MDVVLCRGSGVLQSCVMTKDTELLLKHLNCGFNVNSVNKYHESALFVAAYYGESEMLNLLINFGANVNCTTVDRNTPLHAAAYSGHKAAMAILCAAGANGSLKNNQGYTAEMLFALRNNEGGTSFIESVAPIGRRKIQKASNLAQKTALLASIKFRNNVKRSANNTPYTVTSNSIGYFLPNLARSQWYFTAIPVISNDELDTAGVSAPFFTEMLHVHTSHGKWRGVAISVRCTDQESLSKAHSSKDMRSIFEYRLARELQIVGRLQHPHIRSPLALLLDANTTSRPPKPIDVGLVYERPRLGSLYQFKQDNLEEIPILSALTVCRQVAEALQFIQSFGLVHCNVTPHSIHLYTIDHAKLANFEYAISLSDTSWTSIHNSGVRSTVRRMLDEEPFRFTSADLYHCARLLPPDHLADWLPPELFPCPANPHCGAESTGAVPVPEEITHQTPCYTSDVYSLAKVVKYLLPSTQYDLPDCVESYADQPTYVKNPRMVLEAALKHRPEERLPLKQFHRLLIHLFWSEYDQMKFPKPSVANTLPCPLRLCRHGNEIGTDGQGEGDRRYQLTSLQKSHVSPKGSAFSRDTSSKSPESRRCYVTRRKSYQGNQQTHPKGLNGGNENNSALSKSDSENTTHVLSSRGVPDATSSNKPANGHSPDVIDFSRYTRNSFRSPSCSSTYPNVNCDTYRWDDNHDWSNLTGSYSSPSHMDKTKNQKPHELVANVGPQQRPGGTVETGKPVENQGNGEHMRMSSKLARIYPMVSNWIKQKLLEGQSSKFPCEQFSPSNQCAHNPTSFKNPDWSRSEEPVVHRKPHSTIRNGTLSRSEYVQLAAVPRVPEGVEVPPVVAPWRTPCAPYWRFARLAGKRKESDSSNVLHNVSQPTSMSRHLGDECGYNGGYLHTQCTPVKPASHITRLPLTRTQYSEVTGKPDLIRCASLLSRRNRLTRSDRWNSPTGMPWEVTNAHRGRTWERKMRRCCSCPTLTFAYQPSTRRPSKWCTFQREIPRAVKDLAPLQSPPTSAWNVTHLAKNALTARVPLSQPTVNNRKVKTVNPEADEYCRVDGQVFLSQMKPASRVARMVEHFEHQLSVPSSSAPITTTPLRRVCVPPDSGKQSAAAGLRTPGVITVSRASFAVCSLRPTLVNSDTNPKEAGVPKNRNLLLGPEAAVISGRNVDSTVSHRITTEETIVDQNQVFTSRTHMQTSAEVQRQLMKNGLSSPVKNIMQDGSDTLIELESTGNACLMNSFLQVSKPDQWAKCFRESSNRLTDDRTARSGKFTQPNPSLASNEDENRRDLDGLSSKSRKTKGLGKLQQDDATITLPLHHKVSQPSGLQQLDVTGHLFTLSNAEFQTQSVQHSDGDYTTFLTVPLSAIVVPDVMATSSKPASTVIERSPSFYRWRRDKGITHSHTISPKQCNPTLKMPPKFSAEDEKENQNPMSFCTQNA
ncbi:unnamed protein product [Dicrocoelium dendriticum]|nr:unnamed protein product [Dicrocoelium dendriticum]